MDGEPSPGKQERRVKTSQRTVAGEWRRTFARRRRFHDPLLVLNMSVFNFDDGWNRIFNKPKVHENAPG
jgi:hypothetical protein